MLISFSVSFDAFEILFIFILCAWVFCLRVCPASWVSSQCPRRAEKGVRSPGTRVPDGGDLHVGAGNQTWVL